MNKKIIKAVMSVCAAAGFLSSLFVPCVSVSNAKVFSEEASASDGSVFSETDQDLDESVVQAENPVVNGNVFSAADLVSGTGIVPKSEISASKFDDVDTEAWYFPYVDMLVKNGIINGVSETEYSPSGTFNAAECAAVITRYLGLEKHAVQRRERLVSLGVSGSENWYSGYVQTLFDTGVISDAQFGITSEEGLVVINDPAEFSRPLKRYEFAVMITRSFEIDTEIVSAQSFYPEINANGNSFIVGGKYDGTVEYYANDIADYWYIIDEAQWDVLKAYYNGIFNGDEFGNFNPGAALTRAEMSKVVAVISDPSMRIRKEFRTLPAELVFSEESFVTDGWGEKTLDREVAKLALQKIAEGVAATEVEGKTQISFLPCAYPEGYFVQAHFYDKASGIYVPLGKTELSDSESVSFDGKEPSVLLVLRNSSDAKVEGALRVNVSPDGSLSYDDLFKPVI